MKFQCKIAVHWGEPHRKLCKTPEAAYIYISNLDPKQAKQLYMFIKVSLDSRSSPDGVERPIQILPSAREKVLVGPGMNEERIFTKERKKVAQSSPEPLPFWPG